MVQKQEIEITIQADGRVTYTILGVKGSQCDDLASLLNVIGQVEEEHKTGEYYESDRSGGIVVRH